MIRDRIYKWIERSSEDNVTNSLQLFKVKEKSDGSVDNLKARCETNRRKGLQISL